MPSVSSIDVTVSKSVIQSHLLLKLTAEFRQDDVNPSAPAAMTEFTVMVYRTPTEHRIRLNQVTKWAEHTVKEGPSGIMKPQKFRALLGAKQ